MTDLADGPQATRTGRARLAIGVFQGLALLVLFDRLKPPEGQDVDAWLAALRSAAVFTPIVLLGGLGAVRARTLAIWAAAAAAIAAATAGYAADTGLAGRAGGEFWPPFIGGTAVVLFILHHLVAPADQEQRWRAGYRRYFDLAWTDAVRMALSAAFVGALWGLLALGASLFALIGLKQVRELITEPWFAYPVTATAFAAAVHLTDIRASLVRGVRTVALTLLSWLLPLMTLIVAAFLAALPFTGLEPLWDTTSAAGVVLAAAAALIILVNTAYQDGPREDLAPALKWAGRIGCVALSPLVAIAAYAVALRIDQYGLTPERIAAAICVLVGAAFAVGYLAAALSRGVWLKRLELANFATSHLAVVLLLALMSPLADPRRLSVDDQIRRLDRGLTPPAEFDYGFLKFRAGRWGEAALQDLAARRTGPHAAEIAERAARAMKATNPYDPVAPTTAERALSVAVAGGGALPRSFVEQSWTGREDPLRNCARPVGRTGEPRLCAAVVADIDGDGREDVALFGGGERTVFAEREGVWTRIARLYGPACGDETEAVGKGQARAVPPVARWSDVEVAGRRLLAVPEADCPGDSRPAAGAASGKPAPAPRPD